MGGRAHGDAGRPPHVRGVPVGGRGPFRDGAARGTAGLTVGPTAERAAGRGPCRVGQRWPSCRISPAKASCSAGVSSTDSRSGPVRWAGRNGSRAAASSRSACARNRRSRRSTPIAQTTPARVRKTAATSWRVDRCSGIPTSTHHGGALRTRTVTYLAGAVNNTHGINRINRANEASGGGAADVRSD
ncbi:hypothetical protein GPN2_10986 [Streptomyces murinus]